MPLFRFTPATHRHDPRWQGRALFDEVVVRAPSSGEARRLAATLEAPGDERAMAHAVGNGSEPRTGALDDEKLYRMEPISEDEAAFLARHRDLIPPSAATAGSAILFHRGGDAAPM